MGDVVARRWRVWTRPDRADELEPYLRRTGVGDALATPGNLGALLLRRPYGEHTLFELTTLWLSFAAIRTFAGDEPERAVLYPQDSQLFSVWDERVEHFTVVAQDGLLMPRA